MLHAALRPLDALLEDLCLERRNRKRAWRMVRPSPGPVLRTYRGRQGQECSSQKIRTEATEGKLLLDALHYDDAGFLAFGRKGV